MLLRSSTTSENPERTPWRDDVPTRPAYVHSTSELERELDQLVAAHPSLARVETIGSGALAEAGLTGGRSIRALVLGSRAADPQVPRIMHLAGVHPRELANPELLVTWARRTLDLAALGAPAQQALLAERTIAIVPMVNPEGRDHVLAGLDAGDPTRIWHRTNMNPRGGVDLNRNFDAFWGGAGSDAARPGSSKYAGPKPASESEVRAVQRFVRAFAPAAVYDWHSPGAIVLTPWGHTSKPPAAAAALGRTADVVARTLGYERASSFGEWATKATGTLKDWAHLATGAIALTIETGAYHHQDDAQYADTLRRALPTLDLLAATVDGSKPAPAGAERIATPPPAPPFKVVPPAGSTVAGHG